VPAAAAVAVDAAEVDPADIVVHRHHHHHNPQVGNIVPAEFAGFVEVDYDADDYIAAAVDNAERRLDDWRECVILDEEVWPAAAADAGDFRARIVLGIG